MSRNVSSSEIAHLWAHQTQAAATSPGAMSFSGPDFLSYSTIIATIAKSPSGQQAYILAEPGSYSVTTSKHQGIAAEAIPRGARVFIVPGGGRNNALNDQERIMREWTADVGYKLENANKTAHKGKRERLMGEAAAIVASMRDFAAFFEIKKPVFPLIPTTGEELAGIIAKRDAKAKRDAAQAARTKARYEEEMRKEAAPKMEAWLTGAAIPAQSFARFFPTQLRIEDDEVVTSQGAYFPVEHAKRGLALVESVVARGEEWRANGHTCKLGHYAIDRITPDGTVYAGCHVVPFSSIQRIAEAVRSFVAVAA